MDEAAGDPVQQEPAPRPGESAVATQNWQAGVAMAVAIALEAVASLSLLDNTYRYSSKPSELAANVVIVTEDVLHVGTVRNNYTKSSVLAVSAATSCFRLNRY